MVDGEIVATAEMVWPDYQVALFMEIEEKIPVITDWQLISFQSSDWLARLSHALDINKGN